MSRLFVLNSTHFQRRPVWRQDSKGLLSKVSLAIYSFDSLDEDSDAPKFPRTSYMESRYAIASLHNSNTNYFTVL